MNSNACPVCKQLFIENWVSSVFTYVAHSVTTTQLSEYTAAVTDAYVLADPTCEGSNGVIDCTYEGGSEGDYVWASVLETTETPAVSTDTYSVDQVVFGLNWYNEPVVASGNTTFAANGKVMISLSGLTQGDYYVYSVGLSSKASPLAADAVYSLVSQVSATSLPVDSPVSNETEIEGAKEIAVSLLLLLALLL